MESSKCTYMAKWTEPLTELFVSLMVDEVKMGTRTSCTYNKVGWINIEKKFNEQTGLHFSLTQFKNKAHKLKRKYGSFKKLLSTTGFGWDDDSKKVVVDDETVWANHIKDNTEWAKFRKDGFPLYSQLCVVFGDTYATGEFAMGNAQSVAPSEGTGDSGGGGDNDVHVNLSEPELFFETQADAEQFNVSTSPPPKSHMLDRTPNAKRRRKSSSHSFDATCKAIQEMIKAKTVQTSSASVTSQSSTPVDPYSITNVGVVLNAMPDLNKVLYIKAMKHAVSNASWREGFLTCLPEMRIAFIEAMDE
ncbi:uncharacterized protein LOC115669025 [Syzygium oleosum]|uniref:uncharacterized protein LOC115669025 n=1 Tax=Syzygium oleosum TaxID=219896 RepID=UPI0024BA168B|nr:uncharacterized protein LOC115669025 [Syzygium oleosum]XP_056175215.1 uncharacterized protein LOC115669025 [Syzygium oleosum]XP_056175216.1 uncharacterized protein LOC115669025 [Syzygium oleosum]XP_056175217.1 uncharacterized protein LOC115669025 [Syzygium oleosum]